MNSSEPFNMEKYIQTATHLVEQIIALAEAKNVTFDGNQLGHVFEINETQLLEAMESVNSRLMADYSSYISSRYVFYHVSYL